MDKWDYFLRDNYYTKIGLVFDYRRFITFCQVRSIKLENSETKRRRICIRDKERENLVVSFLCETRGCTST